MYRPQTIWKQRQRLSIAAIVYQLIFIAGYIKETLMCPPYRMESLFVLFCVFNILIISQLNWVDICIPINPHLNTGTIVLLFR